MYLGVVFKIPGLGVKRGNLPSEAMLLFASGCGESPARGMRCNLGKTVDCDVPALRELMGVRGGGAIVGADAEFMPCPS